MARIVIISSIICSLLLISCDLFEADPDETSPTVVMQSFEDTTTVSGTYTIGCSASDDVEMDLVELYIDLFGSGITDNTIPYSFDWDTFTWPNGTYHSIFVRGWDKSGNFADSDTVIVYIDNLTEFSPTNLSATTFNSEIQLEWVDNSEFEDGFGIERDAGTGFVTIDSVAKDITTFTDAGLQYGIEYRYRVYAYVDSIGSNYTNIATAGITFFTLEWIEIGAGNFTFGENDSITSLPYTFEIMQYEVTNSQYISYLEEALARGDIYVGIEAIRQSSSGPLFCNLADPTSMISWNESTFFIEPGFEKNPVAHITWEGAKAYSEHYGWRLPSEHEWEKASRGLTGWDYPWGNDPPTCDLANYSGCYTGTIAVGLTSGDSPYGVYDMVGNVWEWTSDLYEAGPERVIKGGTWSYYTEHLQVWYSLPVVPDYTHYLIGFRCARDI